MKLNPTKRLRNIVLHHSDHNTAPDMDVQGHLLYLFVCSDWKLAFYPVNRVHADLRLDTFVTMVALFCVAMKASMTEPEFIYKLETWIKLVSFQANLQSLQEMQHSNNINDNKIRTFSLMIHCKSSWLGDPITPKIKFNWSR